MKSLSRVRPSATLWTAAFQAPPSMGFSRQEYWSGVPLPSPAMDPHKQIFYRLGSLGPGHRSFCPADFLSSTIVSLSGLQEISDCSPSCVHKNLRSGPLVHFLRLLTPLELLHHPGIMQSSTPLHVAWSCPCRSKPSAPESPQAYLMIPSSLDLQILT